MTHQQPTRLSHHLDVVATVHAGVATVHAFDQSHVDVRRGVVAVVGVAEVVAAAVGVGVDAGVGVIAVVAVVADVAVVSVVGVSFGKIAHSFRLPLALVALGGRGGQHGRSGTAPEDRPKRGNDPHRHLLLGCFASLRPPAGLTILRQANRRSRGSARTSQHGYPTTPERIQWAVG
jgi:hypothetical protein